MTSFNTAMANRHEVVANDIRGLERRLDSRQEIFASQVSGGVATELVRQSIDVGGAVQELRQHVTGYADGRWSGAGQGLRPMRCWLPYRDLVLSRLRVCCRHRHLLLQRVLI